MRVRRVLFVVLVMGAVSVLPAMANAKLEGIVELVASHGVCYAESHSHYIRVAGSTVNISADTEFKGLPCDEIKPLDSAKVECTDDSCDWAKKVETKKIHSAESAVKAWKTEDCGDEPEYLTLKSGQRCDLDGYPPAEFKIKKDLIPGVTTLQQYFEYLCTANDGDPGTLEVNCSEAHLFDLGVVYLYDPEKIEVKK